MRYHARPSSSSCSHVSSHRSNRFFFSHQPLSKTLLMLGVMVCTLAVGQSSSVSYAMSASGGERLLAVAPVMASIMPPVADTTPPSVTITSSAGPPAQVQFTIQDADSGLASIVVTKSENADTVVPPFTVGTTNPVVVTGTKIDQSQPMQIEMRVEDVAGNSRVVVFSQIKMWTTTGNASTSEDESNPAKPTYTNQTAAINGGPLGSYTLRYNVTAVDGLFNNPANSFMRVRVRDNGAGANVLILLRRSSITAGGTETIATFDSDSIGAASGFQTPADVTFNHMFDFTNYVYWLEVTLKRIDATGLPGFAAASIGNTP